jgi:hypothetical protein
MCSTCNVTLRKTVWLCEYHMKNITERVQNNLMFPDIYYNISFKKLPWNIICIDVKNECILPAFFTYILYV